MSAREWKPGDVALVTSMYGTEVVAIRTGVPSNMGWAYSMDLTNGPGPGGSASTQSWSSDRDGAAVIRPLAVIDPDDRAQVERLWDLFGAAKAYGPDALQAALRELANPTPPKPDEPTGLGAVVETPGGRYVRSDVETCNPWRGPNGIPFEWDDLDGPIRVLSEGVQP